MSAGKAFVAVKTLSPETLSPETHSHTRTRDLWTITLIVVVWSWIMVPKTIQTLLSPKYRSSVGVENAPYSKLASIADYALYWAVIAVCVLIIIGYLRDVNTPALARLAAMLLPWIFIVIRDLYVPTAISHEGICYAMIVLATWFLRPDLRLLQSLGYLMGLTAALSVLIALVVPAQAIFRTALGEVITDDKQIIPGGLLVGLFTQGNNLGQFLALGLPTIFLIRRRWWRLVLVALACLAIVWSASRGAMIAVGTGVIAYGVTRVCRPTDRKFLGPAVILAPILVVCVVPFTTQNPLAFSNRGLVWIQSLRAWSSHPWLGNGADWYQIVGSTSNRIAGSVFHAHNQLVQFLVTGGVVFALLVVPQILVATVRATRFAVEGSLFGVVWMATLAASCLFEKSFAFVDNGNFLIATVVPFAFLVFGHRGSPEAPESETDDDSRTGRPTVPISG